MNRATVLALALMAMMSGCWDGESDSKRWVAIEPTQCLTNPWEQDWLAQHDDDYQGYPGHGQTLGEEEFEIIQNYYAGLGVAVSGGRTMTKYQVVCDACSCPQGHTLFLKVGPDDIDTMLDLGYRLATPPPAPWSDGVGS
jgi:hypothetical protein